MNFLRHRAGSLLVFLLPGCSMIFVEPAPSNYASLTSYDCTTTKAAPVVDTILALSNLGTAAYVAGHDNAGNKQESVTLALSVATMWAGSAIYGYWTTSKCSEAKEENNGVDMSYYRSPFRFSPAQR
jgi:hypothetical protein